MTTLTPAQRRKVARYAASRLDNHLIQALSHLQDAVRIMERSEDDSLPLKRPATIPAQLMSLARTIQQNISYKRAKSNG